MSRAEARTDPQLSSSPLARMLSYEQQWAQLREECKHRAKLDLAQRTRKPPEAYAAVVEKAEQLLYRRANGNMVGPHRSRSNELPGIFRAGAPC